MAEAINATMAIIVLLAMCVYVPMALRYLRTGFFEDRDRRPQWQREADFLARAIPTGHRWNGLP